MINFTIINLHNYEVLVRIQDNTSNLTISTMRLGLKDQSFKIKLDFFFCSLTFLTKNSQLNNLGINNINYMYLFNNKNIKYIYFVLSFPFEK